LKRIAKPRPYESTSSRNADQKADEQEDGQGTQAFVDDESETAADDDHARRCRSDTEVRGQASVVGHDAAPASERRRDPCWSLIHRRLLLGPANILVFNDQ
jgi:hypothetical protein